MPIETERPLLVKSERGKLYCAFRHNADTVRVRRFRDGFRLRLMVKCPHCDLSMGPFLQEWRAKAELRRKNDLMRLAYRQGWDESREVRR